MELQLFAGMPVGDYPRAVAWYERFFGEPATFVSHETECVWTLADGRSIYIERRSEHAGHAMVTFFPDDLDAFVGAAAERGVEPVDREQYGEVRKLVYRDPDGNEIGVGGGPPEVIAPETTA